ncbi:MAG TPA: M20 family metallopeptidase [Thermoanaerobaculia bacterium]
METARQVLAHLQARREEMGDLLRALALLESPSLVAESQEPVFARLAVELEAAGMRTRRLRGRLAGGQLWAVPRDRRTGPGQLLLGHCDTVWPVGTLASMPVEIRDGRLTGPGVYDMKAGLVQGIFALRALRDLGLEPEVTPCVFINSDEEIGSVESLARIERLARRVHRVFVLEPSLGPEGKLKTRRKGSLRFTVRVHGRAAHSGLDPEKGASAILELARVIQRLYDLAEPGRGLTVNVGVVSGGLRRNVVAPEAQAEVDVRVMGWDDALRIERTVLEMKAATPGTSLEVTGGIDRPPLEATPGNRVLWEAAKRRAEELGFTLGEGTAGGASDGSLTSRFTPTLDGLGAVGDGAHAVHEHVLLDRMPERAALLALLLLEPETKMPGQG